MWIVEVGVKQECDYCSEPVAYVVVSNNWVVWRIRKICEKHNKMFIDVPCGKWKKMAQGEK